MIYILLYLGSIVAANLLIAYFGAPAAIIVAFIFIGLDLTVRDYLHESWHNKGLVWKMGLLIASGSLISWILNYEAAKIAIASFSAFAAAGIADALIYQLLKDKARVMKVNGSNVVSSGVDSLVFLTIAFGGFIPDLFAKQFAAKVVGGAIWFVIINFIRKKWSRETAV